MTPEAHILAAFWQRNQGRFCELTGDEVRLRSGYGMTGDHAKTLIETGEIAFEKYDSHQGRLYRLTRDGEARVTAMIVLDTLPKPKHRLTAIPPPEKRERR